MEPSETALAIFALEVAADQTRPSRRKADKKSRKNLEESLISRLGSVRGPPKSEDDWSFFRNRASRREEHRGLQEADRNQDDDGRSHHGTVCGARSKCVPVSDAESRAMFDKRNQDLKVESASSRASRTVGSPGGVIDVDEANMPEEDEIALGEGPGLRISTVRGDRQNTARLASAVKAEPLNDVALVQKMKDEPSDEQIRDALACMKNADAKVKKDLTFSDRILYRRIQKIGLELYPVEDSVNKYFLFSRYYFSNRYGGSFVATFPTLSAAKLKEHGIDDWAFPSLEYNPHAPQVPGAPGLFYTPNGHARTTFDHRVFVRLDGGKWLYVGMYTFAPSDSLTPDEFSSQPDKIKKTWAREMKTHSTWGTNVTGRVYFRRENNGKEPTEAELDEVLLDKTALARVTEEEIIQAYSTGQEVFGVFSMKCIGYDAKWIAGLIEDYPSWLEEREAQLKRNKAKKSNEAVKKTPRRKKNKDKANSITRTTKQSPGAATTGTKRKAEELDSTCSSDDEQPETDTSPLNSDMNAEDDGTDLDIIEPVYVPRPTRSRGSQAQRTLLDSDVLEIA